MSVYLAPKHHGRALPEALVGLAPPVADHPLEDGVLGEHKQDADDDTDDEQQVEASVLVERHPRSLALQLSVGRVVGAAAALEEQVAHVVCEPAVVVLQDLLRQLRLCTPKTQFILYFWTKAPEQPTRLRLLVM